MVTRIHLLTITDVTRGGSKGGGSASGRGGLFGIGNGQGAEETGYGTVDGSGKAKGWGGRYGVAAGGGTGERSNGAGTAKGQGRAEKVT